GIEVLDDLSPVSQRERVALAVAAGDLFDRAGSVFGAELVEHQTLKPIERIDDDGFVLMVLTTEVGKRRQYLVIVRGQRELVAVDLIETVFSLNEDGVGSVGGERRFAHPFDPITKDPRRLRNSSPLDSG